MRFNWRTRWLLPALVLLCMSIPPVSFLQHLALSRSTNRRQRRGRATNRVRRSQRRVRDRPSKLRSQVLFRVWDVIWERSFLLR
jgi:hypothetical protein